MKSSENQSNKMILGSWNYPLRGQPIKYVLELARFPYEDKTYRQNEKNEWVHDKLNLGLAFPSIPYLIHKNMRLTEAQVILEYVIDVTEMHELRGSGNTRYLVDNVRYMCDEMLDVINASSEKEDGEKLEYIENLILPKFRILAANLQDKVFFFQNMLTLADIYVYSSLVVLMKNAPASYRKIENQFKRFLTNFQNIPLILAYHVSPRYEK